MFNIQSAISDHIAAASRLSELTGVIWEACQLTIQTLSRGNKVLLAGNGGSAADAQHLAAELVGRFKSERIALPAIALTTDSSVLTAVANDYGYEHVFARQLAALGREGDLFIGISTSGNSPNIVRAMEYAQTSGISIIAFLGKDGGALKHHPGVNIIVPSQDTARIQEMHILIGHILCDAIDNSFKSS